VVSRIPEKSNCIQDIKDFANFLHVGLT
jgi:hypothetical protein